MRIGLLAYSTNTGLGIQSQEFYNHIPCEKVMLIDISKFNGYQTHHERFPGAFCITNGFPTDEEIYGFVKGLDVIFCMETPLNYNLYKMAEDRGVKTIQQFNWEFLDYINRPELPKPTLFAAPSRWEWDKFPYPEKRRLLHVPVNREKLPPRDIKQFKNFLHIMGNPAAHDRNGTLNTIRAFTKVPKKDITLTVRVQNEEKGKELKNLVSGLGDSRIKIDNRNLDNYWDSYNGYDFLIMSRRYGGLCLPMQEALSCGMPVLMTDISPNNEFLPMNWLVPAQKISQFEPRSVVDIYDAPENLLAKYIIEFANMNEEEATIENDVAKHLGDILSWEKQKPIYEELFNELIKKEK